MLLLLFYTMQLASPSWLILHQFNQGHCLAYLDTIFAGNITATIISIQSLTPLSAVDIIVTNLLLSLLLLSVLSIQPLYHNANSFAILSAIHILVFRDCFDSWQDGHLSYCVDYGDFLYLCNWSLFRHCCCRCHQTRLLFLLSMLPWLLLSLPV